MKQTIEILNESICGFFADNFDSNLEVTSLGEKPTYRSEHDTTGHIGMADLKANQAGMILINIPTAQVRSLCASMYGVEIDNRTKIHAYVMEFLNQIAGLFTGPLYDHGHDVDVFLPNPIIERGRLDLGTLRKEPFVYYRFAGGIYDFKLAYCFYEAITFD